MSGEHQEGGNKPPGLPEGRPGRRPARARRVSSQPVDTQTSPIVPRGPEAETSEPLSPVQEALTRAHRNLVVWHESLIDSNPALFKKGGLLPVVSNGRTINYRVSVNPAKKYEDESIIWPLGEPVDRLNISTTDPQLKGRPRSVVISYQPGRISQTDAIRSVEVNWNDPDGLTGEAVVCSEGRIDFILKAGKNSIYWRNPFYEDIKDAGFNDKFFQDMGLQFVYDQDGNLQHYYTRLANWDYVQFYYADGKAWNKDMAIPDFPLKSRIWKDLRFPVEKDKEGIADKNSFDVERIWSESSAGEHYLNPSTAKWQNLVTINNLTPDGRRFCYTSRVFLEEGPNRKGEYQAYTMELPTTFDAIPHIRSAFPATFPGVTPLLHGQFGRKLRLEMESPKTPAQEYLIKIVQDLTREGAAWEGVTGDDLKETYEFLTRPDILTATLDDISNPYDTYAFQDRIFDILPKTIPLGYMQDAIRAGVMKLIESGALRELAKVHGACGLSGKDLKWTLGAILQGQTELILRSKEKGGLLSDLQKLQASVVNRLSRRS